jgi:phage-related protein
LGGVQSTHPSVGDVAITGKHINIEKMYRIWYTLKGIIPMNEVEWNKKALREVKTFPEEVKKEIGYLIFKLQIGESLSMPHARTMTSVAKGCYELRVKDRDGIYRVFYFLKIKSRILIFHAFQKKEQRTPIKEIDLGRKNLKEMLDERN